MTRLSWGVLYLALAGTAAAVQVPVEEEPHHHVMFRNDSVVVMHIMIPPGESTLYHTHAHDRVAVALTSNTITLQPLDKPEGLPNPSQPGDLSAPSLAEGPYTHRVHNIGPGPYEVVDVEVLQRPRLPSDPSAAIAMENPSARVYKWILPPGGATEMHSHARPYVIVAVTPTTLKMTGPDGKSMTQEVKAGDFHWIDSKVTHTIANVGTLEAQIVEIELK